MSVSTDSDSQIAWTWYLLPICLSILGGGIAYCVLRNRDRRTANNCLYLGAISLILNIGLQFVLPFPWPTVVTMGCIAYGVVLLRSRKPTQRQTSNTQTQVPDSTQTKNTSGGMGTFTKIAIGFGVLVAVVVIGGIAFMAYLFAPEPGRRFFCLQPASRAYITNWQ